MAYKQVSYGSRGIDVTELQKKLNENGYQLTVDGAFGSKTKAAVQDYQKKNGLAVDGIVGENTWGSLTAAKQPETVEPVQQVKTETVQPTGQETANPEDAYVETVQKLQQSQRQPPQYGASYDEQMNQLFQKIMNREKFDYNPNSDPMYQQYRDLYMQQGQQAAQDTMGQAAGLTGGYGSSYSQNAGQQAYNAYLQRLNEVVPELYGEAASRYAQEGEEMYRQYAALGDLRDTEYGRYQDEYDRYVQGLEMEYQQQRDQVADERWEKELAYQQDRDKVSDDRWAQELAYQQNRDKISDEQWEREFAEAQRQFNESLKKSGSGGGYVVYRDSGDDPQGKKMTAESTPDKIWSTPSAQDLYNPNATYNEVARSIKAALQSGQTDFADRLAEAYYNNRPEWREKMIAEGLAEALQ